MSEGPISEADLIAYADNRLAADRRPAVEAWLALHPERAAEVAAWERQNEAIAALYNPIANEPIPGRLDPHLIATRAARPRVTWPGMAAAAVVLLGLGLGGGYLLNDAVNPAVQPAGLLIENAVTAHALFVKENRHAVEVAADERQHLLTWLSNRIETAIVAPDLAIEGFSLVGGRLLPAGTGTGAGPAAQLMYENAAAQRLTVYITGPLPDGEETTEFTSVAGLDAFYWANDTVTCTVVGDLADATMQTVANKVFLQLTRRPDYQGI